ncbi:MAG: DUF2917 domain-containing protein [Betaproteobacteria bacterium]
MRALPSGLTSLPRHVSLSLLDRAGDRIECAAGVLWITQDRDPRDIVLTPGRSFRLDRAGRAVVYALEDARLALHRRPRRTLARRLTHAIVALRRWWSRPGVPAAARGAA